MQLSTTNLYEKVPKTKDIISTAIELGVSARICTQQNIQLLHPSQADLDKFLLKDQFYVRRT